MAISLVQYYIYDGTKESFEIMITRLLCKKNGCINTYDAVTGRAYLSNGLIMDKGHIYTCRFHPEFKVF